MSLAPPFPIIDGQYKMEREPIVRIGVILEADRKPDASLRIPIEGYRIEADGAVITTGAAVGEYLVRTEGADKVSLVDTQNQILVNGAKAVRLTPPPPASPLKAGDGTLVRAIVAGRGFHWLKTIDQTLTHVLEFCARGSALIMINEIPIETYLVGVITGEMGSDCPVEFMKAQAVAARSWLLGQPSPPHPGEPFLWCNDDCCQRYQGTGGWSEQAVRAIDECRGEVLITKGKCYCDARYSKSTGGISEDAESVWGYPIAGLVARVDAPADSPIHRFFPIKESNFDEYLDGEWLKTTDAFASPNVAPESTLNKYLGRVDEIGEYFRWTVTLTHADLKRSLRERAGIGDLEELIDLLPGGRGRSGRLEALVVYYQDKNGERKTQVIRREYYIRAAMSSKFLYSGAFRIQNRKRAANGSLASVELRGAGWGHGAGLCQIGALGRSLKGQDYATILLHYYSDVKLERIYT